MILRNIIVFLIVCIHSSKTQIINTTSGSVRGLTLNVLNRTVEQYLGIPYAEPPVHNLRFAKPKPLEKPIEGIIDATKPKSSCYQLPNNVLGVSEDISEDCLTLNIWNIKRENNLTLMPVMYFIFGGALTLGSIFQPVNNGSILATHDLVLVSVNYRVGWLGNLYGGEESAPGNLGLYDQVLGLKWVRDNIHEFGGDKNQITILGVSAGSWCASIHILSPMSKGLFKRAILLSGAHFNNKDRPLISRDEALLKSKEFAKSIDCSGKYWLQCLRALNAEEFQFGPAYFFPVDGTEFLPFTAQKAFELGQYNKVDLLAGFAKDEGSLLSFIVNPLLALSGLLKFRFQDFLDTVHRADIMYHNLVHEKLAGYYLNGTNVNNSTAVRSKIWEFTGDIAMKCPTYLFAKRFSKNASPETNVYLYELTYAPASALGLGSNMGVHHIATIELMFGLPLTFQKASEEDKEFSKEFMKLFTDFAKKGKPDSEWYNLVGFHALPALEFIKDLNPRHRNKSSTGLYQNSCNVLWKDYY